MLLTVRAGSALNYTCAVVLFGGIAGGFFACSEAQQQKAVIAATEVGAAAPAVAAVVGGEADIRGICASAGKLFSSQANSTNATVRDIAVDGDAFCAAVNSGKTPPATDQNSATWLLGLISGLTPLIATSL